MADQFTVIEAPLIGGIDQRTDARKVPGVRLLSALNLQIDKTGAYGRRFGTVTRGTPTASGSKVFEYEGELVAAGLSNIYARCDNATYAWKTKDALPEVTDVVARTVAAVSQGAYNGDVAYYSSKDLLVYCWATANNTASVYVLGVERATGHVLFGPQRVSSAVNATAPRVIVVGDYAVVAWHQQGSANSPGVRADISVASPSWSAVTNITTDSQAAIGGVFDMHAIDSTNFLFAYERNAGANRCRLAKIVASSFAASATVDLTDAVTGRQAISIDVQAGERTWVAYMYNDGGATFEVHAAIVNETTMVETVAPTQVESQAAATFADGYLDIVRFSSTQASVTWWQNGAGAATDGQLRGATLSTACAVVGSVRYLGWKLVPCSRQFVQGGKAYQMVLTQDMAPATTPSNMLIDTGADDTSTTGLQARAVALAAPRYAVSSFSHHRQGHLASCVNPTTNEWRTLGSEAQGLPSSVGVGTPFLVEYMLTFDYKKRMAAELGGLIYLSGGVPMWFDGVRAAEVGFFAMGEISSLVVSNGAGSLDTSATYGYQSCFAFRDRKGNMHRSGASAIASTTTGGTDDTVDGVADYLTVTARTDAATNGSYPPVLVEIYRTEGGGSIYKRLTTEAAATANDTSDANGVFAFTDLASDASISGLEIIYTQGAPVLGQLDNVCPPSASILIVHRDRIVLAGCPNREQVWLSKKYVPGFAPGFNEALVFTIDDGGDITGLASMDGRLIVFKADRIFYIDGDGPDNLGQNNDWGSPVRINGTVGCIDPRSIVVTPIGIVFQSRAGISLLDRGLNVVAEWGDAVQTELTTYPYVIYATLHPTRTEIRLGIANASVTSSEELRYDYRAKSWFVAQYTDSGGGLVPVSAAAVGTDYIVAMSSGEVFREATSSDATAYLDDSDTYVTTIMELAPVSSAGTLGYQNVAEIMLLSETHTGHQPSIQVATDDGTYDESKTWTTAEVATLDTVHELRYVPLRAGKCRMVKLKFLDAVPTSGSVGTGRGQSLISVAFKVAKKEGTYRLLGSTAKG